MKKCYFLLLFVFIAGMGNSPLPHVTSGTIKRFSNFPSKYVDARNVDVWLPGNYSPAKKYAVLYMQDGQMLFDSAVTWNHREWKVDETMGELLRENKIRDCIVVGIWNNGNKRHAEYFPQKVLPGIPDSARNELMKLMDNTALGDNYLKFLVSELKPFIDSSFSTKKDRSNTFIAGSSMGGLISLYAICEYPDVFGGAACLSTHWTGIYRADHNPIPSAILKYMSENLPSPRHHKIYFDHGTKTLDSLYAPFQLEADSILKQKAYTDKNFESKIFKGADHSEDSWAKRLDVPLEFLLKK